MDDFGVKYVGKEHVHHLLDILRDKYPAVAKDWTGGIYCGVTLKWNYDDRYMDIAMPGYIT